MAVASKTWTASYGRYVQLRITAQEVEVDVPNNRSKVRVTGQIYYPGGTRATNAYPQTYTVTVNGTQIGRQTGITYNLASGGTRSLTTYTSGWINHNSNGAKSVTVRGHITDGAGDTGTISQSYALTTIARASTLSSFSMPNHLKPSTTTSFSLGITRRSSSFTHDIQLRDGTTVIASWTGQGTPTALSLTSTQTNTLLKRMSSSTSRTMTLRVQTKSGSTNIGGALTRTATVYVHSSVTPNVSGLSVAIEGNAHAKNNVKRFVQNISRVSGSFTRNATGGASIRSSKLEIRRKSGGADLQTINSNSGTFSRAVALSGQYQARGTATDSRGRSSNTGWVDLSNFNVLAYSAPQITNFKTTRWRTVPTTIGIERYGTHSGLSGKNVLTIRVQKRASGATSWTNLVPDVTTTNNAFGVTIENTGNSIASSYDFRLYVVDQFGNSAERFSTVSTQRVVLDIHKNEGVGIGKIHENGVLDVDGEAHFKGELFVNGVGISRTQEFLNVNPNPTDTVGFWSQIPQGKYYVGTGQVPNQPTNYGIMDVSNLMTDYTIMWYALPTGEIYRKSGNARTATDWKLVQSTTHGGSTGNYWIRFADGTQICHGVFSLTAGSVTYRLESRRNFPVAFSAKPAVTMNTQWMAGGGTAEANIASKAHSVTATQWTPTVHRASASWSGTYDNISYIAVGRWK